MQGEKCRMSIEKFLEEKASTINKTLEKYVPREFDKNAIVFALSQPEYGYNLEALNKAIAEPIWEFLERGGKRWRPSLFLLVIEALGKNSKNFLDFAIIPELIHNGTLIVDDIEDDSKIRREKPCTHILYGLDIAINAGNAMYYLPLLTLIKNKDKFPATKMNRIYEIYVLEMINLSFGQAMDIAWHRGLADADKIEENQYLQMCAYKTGTLARMSAKIAALLADADDELTENLGKFAETIGVAFQIQDDILDLVGEEFAKKKGGLGKDITEGKRTLIVIHTLKKATQNDKKRFLEILHMRTTDTMLIEEAISIMKKYNSIEYTREFSKNMVKESWKKVEKFLPPSKAKEKLKAFANYLIERKI
jgi:geranylgeranyl pyrophosphate synthase